jgi:hypothetical protein
LVEVGEIAGRAERGDGLDEVVVDLGVLEEVDVGGGGEV